VCGSAFPPNCNLIATALYACSGPGAPPTEIRNCTTGCQLTTPNNTCNDCTSAANSVVAQLNTLQTNIQGVTAALPGTWVGLNTLAGIIAEVQANLTQAPTLTKTELASAANAAQQVSDIASSLISSYSNETLPAGVPNPTTVFGTTLPQLNTLIQALLTCTGPATGCDVTTRFVNDVLPLVNNQLDALQPTYPTPVLFDFAKQSFTNASTTIFLSLATLNSSGLGLVNYQLATTLSLVDPSKLGGDATYSQAVKTAIAALKVATQCLGITSPADICPTAMSFLATWVQFIEDNLPVYFGTVAGLSEFVLAPTVSAFDQVKSDLASGNLTLFPDAASTLAGALQLLTNVVAPLLPDPGRTEFAALNQGVLDTLQPLTSCTGTLNPCKGEIEFGAAFIQGAIGQLRSLPAIGTAGAPFFAAAQSLVDALKTGSTASIQTALGAINAPLKAFALVPGVSTNPFFQGIQSTVNTLNTCVPTNP
ncbi:hypothetical protein DFQ27_009694, partial [Actinomortierella ambigua]